MVKLVKLTLGVKISVVASLISLFVYNGYILRGSLVILFGYLSNISGDVAYVMFVGYAFWAGYVSLIGRLISLILALISVYLLWVKSWPFPLVRKLVAASLVLEGINFLGLVPSLWFFFRPAPVSFPISLGIGYLLQILFTVPFLWALAYQVMKYQNDSQKTRLLKVGALAFVGYIVALVANEVSRWASMISISSLRFIEGIRAVGFFNALLLMPFAIVFAVLGAFRLYQMRERSAMKWVGVSLVVIGLNYTIYLIYIVIVNLLNTLPLVDIWTLPLLAVGLTLILNSRSISE